MRIPLPNSLKTRTGIPDKDPRMTNCYVEVKGNDAIMRKRAGINSVTTTIIGDAQGGIEIPGGAVVVNEDTLTVVVEVIDGTNIADVAAVSDQAGGSLADNATAVADSVGVPIGGLNWAFVFPTCESITLPAASDRGTTQYAGPSETPYSVPQTTITDTLILETNCWNLYRRSTKTYSQRTRTDLSKYSVAWSSGSAYELYAWGGGVDYYPGAPGYPANGNAAIAAWIAANPVYSDTTANAAIQLSTPLTAAAPDGAYSSVFDEINIKLSGAAVSNTVRVTYETRQYISGSFKFFTTDVYSVSSLGTLTLYYLDVHEVWTYYII